MKTYTALEKIHLGHLVREATGLPPEHARRHVLAAAHGAGRLLPDGPAGHEVLASAAEEMKALAPTLTTEEAVKALTARS